MSVSPERQPLPLKATAATKSLDIEPYDWDDQGKKLEDYSGSCHPITALSCSSIRLLSPLCLVLRADATTGAFVNRSIHQDPVPTKLVSDSICIISLDTAKYLRHVKVDSSLITDPHPALNTIQLIVSKGGGVFSLIASDVLSKRNIFSVTFDKLFSACNAPADAESADAKRLAKPSTVAERQAFLDECLLVFKIKRAPPNVCKSLLLPTRGPSLGMVDLSGDMVLVSKSERSFRCHQHILAAESPFFTLRHQYARMAGSSSSSSSSSSSLKAVVYPADDFTIICILRYVYYRDVFGSKWACLMNPADLAKILVHLDFLDMADGFELYASLFCLYVRQGFIPAECVSIACDRFRNRRKLFERELDLMSPEQLLRSVKFVLDLSTSTDKAVSAFADALDAERVATSGLHLASDLPPCSPISPSSPSSPPQQKTPEFPSRKRKDESHASSSSPSLSSSPYPNSIGACASVHVDKKVRFERTKTTSS